VEFKLLPAVGDEAAGDFVQARSNHLKSFVSLGKDSFQRADFLLENVQTRHGELRESAVEAFNACVDGADGRG
jgi:hypothetical protein